MSTQTRTTPRGGRNAKQDTSTTTSKLQKSDTKSDPPKTQPTAEQMRIAQIIDTRTDDTHLKVKVKEVMDATQKTEDEVIAALHDCDNDPNKAVNMLLEGQGQGAWETSVKKKKNRQSSTSKTGDIPNNRTDEVEGDKMQESGNTDKDRSRTRGGGPPRMRGRGDNRGWRGRENKENEQNQEEGFSRNRGEGGPRRGRGGMANGPRTGRGRGGRGGGVGRTFQGRDKSGGGFPKSIETWNNPGQENTATDNIKMENWGDFPSPEDWDNEEYTGSLADSKVFTPSSSIEPSQPAVVPQPDPATQSQDYLQSSPLQVPVGTLNAAQTQYLSQLTAQAENLKTAVGIGNTSNTYGSTTGSTYGQAANTSPNFGQSENLKAAVGGAYQTTGTGATYGQAGGYGQAASTYQGSTTGYQTQNYVQPGQVNYSSNSTFQSSTGATSYGQSGSYLPSSGTAGNYAVQNSTNYGSQSYGASVNYVNQMQPDGSVSDSQSSQPARAKSQRARVPPPSKIPQTAVEMPEDSANANISFLDVQFGGLEFGESNSLENEQQNKFQTSSVPPAAGGGGDSIPVTSANVDIISSQSTGLDGYSSTNSGNSGVKSSQATLVSALTGKSVLTGNEALLQSTDHKGSYSSPPSRVTSATSNLDQIKSDVGLSYTAPSAANYQTYQSQTKNNSYQPTSYSTTNYSSTAPQVSTSVSQNQNYSTSSSGTTYNNQTGTGYQNSSYTTNSYPISQTSNTYQTTNQGYQNSGQSVYGTTLGTGYSSNSQYPSNYGTNSSQNKLTNSGKDTQDYTSVASTASTTNSASSQPSLGLSSASQTVNTTTTKVTSASTKSGIVTNIPAGVPPMVGTQYIMSQTGMPYFQPTPAMYSYEDLQLLQQRIPHVQAGYYDMSYQAPTSRENIANVAYSMSDARYTRGDNNASPVPSTLSQQPATQAHQQPMMNPHHSLPPGYTMLYGYGTGIMPGSFQYGTPIYPVPTVTNHGTTATTQYPKPTTYGSAYGSGYDGLSQTQDYTKSAYVSTNQTQSKTATAGSSTSNTSDLNASVYGKSHTTLGKVNSYEKQAFHSGTPPPFNLAANQGTGIAPTGSYPPLFIPTLTHQQHHGTTLMHQPLLQDASNSTGQRTAATSQPNKTGSKQPAYNTYWSPN